MADTDKLRPYEPTAFPTLGDERRYILQELQRLSATLKSIGSVMKSLESRIAAGGL